MIARFRSVEESIVAIGALVTAAISYKLFDATLVMSIAWATAIATLLAYLTFHEFTLEDEAVIYRNRFMQRRLPLEWIRKVGVRNFWGGLPGKTYMFVLNRPPAPWNGYFRRTGLLTWPMTAERWVAEVNAIASQVTGERQP